MNRFMNIKMNQTMNRHGHEHCREDGHGHGHGNGYGCIQGHEFSTKFIIFCFFSFLKESKDVVAIIFFGKNYSIF